MSGAVQPRSNAPYLHSALVSATLPAVQGCARDGTAGGSALHEGRRGAVAGAQRGMPHRLRQGQNLRLAAQLQGADAAHQWLLELQQGKGGQQGSMLGGSWAGTQRQSAH